MNLIEKIRENAKSDKKIVLPEAMDERIMQASEYLLNEEICKIVLLGEEKEIEKKIESLNLNLGEAEIIECEKGKELDKAIELLNSEKVDGMLAGAVYSTPEIARKVLREIGLKENVKTLSGAFLIVSDDKLLGEQGAMVFSDCAIVINPSAEQLAEIALNAGKFFKEIVEAEPKIALLSFSTHGSASHESLEKIRKAKAILNEKFPSLKVDGELQVDTAIIQGNKAIGSGLKGKANVLIFPDLNSGNIGYKLAERFGKTRAIGPLLLGTKKPVNDLSRDCSVDDIIDSVCITLIEAEENQKS